MCIYPTTNKVDKVFHIYKAEQIMRHKLSLTVVLKPCLLRTLGHCQVFDSSSLIPYSSRLLNVTEVVVAINQHRLQMENLKYLD